MVGLPQVYNTADLPDTGGAMPLITPGQYPAVIVESGLKPTSNGQGQFLWLKVIITQGQFQGTEFTERLNIINPSAEAMQIAYKTLARISEAVGMNQTPGDSVQLHNKPFIIEVATEQGKPYIKDGVTKEGKDKSIIKKYLGVPGVGGQGFNPAGVPQNIATAPAPGGFTPPMATAPVQSAAPMATPAAPAVATPPAHNPFAPPR